MTATPALDRFEGLVPNELLDVPGHAFYAGETAFSGTSPLYLLGLNPGGTGSETVRQQIQSVRTGPGDYSAFRTHTWKRVSPIDRSVLHMLSRLSLDPGVVPASCLVFQRSTSESELAGLGITRLATVCWPFHQAVIDNLGVRAVVCFGGTAGRYARKQLDADLEVDRFVETNARGWTSRTHVGVNEIKVVTVSHPSRADWRNPAADVSPLVARALAL